MRILTVISGIVITACGAFCFAVSGNLFASIAFVVGVTMVISGGCNIGAYLISGKGHNRLTETTLVEGLVTFFYGFAVLNDQVNELTLMMFFGTWLTVCGVTRVSQSLYVSRFNPKDWAKIIPLAAVASMLGVVMMMPKILVAAAPLMLVGGAFILDGLSMLMFAMYMKKRALPTAEGEIKAREREEAKRAVAKAERIERDRLRNLSKHEREAELERQREAKAKEDAAKKAEIAAQKAARRQAARPASERTMEFTLNEIKDINTLADKVVKIEDEDEVETVTLAEKAPEAPAEELVNVPVEDLQTRPVWQRPTDIPKVRQEAKPVQKESEITSLRFTAVNLEEIESGKTVVEFEKVELPELKLASDNEAADRKEVLKEIDKVTIKKEDLDYTPIDLEELVKEPLARPVDPNEAKRFTQTLNFHWVEVEK
ncbi:MAG: hypothetical protein MJ150_03570 [Clostridia bacterium]|nr:hypothetical protein [Clostridia bacterium]